MRASRVAGLLFLATASLAQQQQSVEITSEPSHHLVFQNEYVRVFDVTVAPRATTLIHKHNHDYLFVTLGDSDVVSARVGEKPAALQLKDGEVRFTPGNFAHAAINKSDRPFHNITIELLKPSSNVKNCADACEALPPCSAEQKSTCASVEKRIASDQWTVSMVTLPPSTSLEKNASSLPHLLIAVSELDLASVAATETGSGRMKRGPGGLAWVPRGKSHWLANDISKPAQFVTLEFKPEKQNQ
jgi:quercetin dioxygenase-like cupin family protein